MTDPLLGWRCWLVAERDGQPMLKSPSRGTLWQPGRMMAARCPQGAEHTPPGENCSCGIYALASLANLRPIWKELLPLRLTKTEEDIVVAHMALAGDVAEGTIGYRAEVAYPARLYVPTLRWPLAQRLRDAWGCDTRLWNPYSEWKE
jgi:hypothetical protein